MDEALKLRREEFVSGHNGGTFIEVVALTSLLQISHVVYSSFLFACPALIPTPNDSTRKRLLCWSFDYLCLVLPFIFAITVASDYIFFILLAQVAIIALNFWFYIRRHKIDIFSQLSHYNGLSEISIQYPILDNGKPSDRLPFVTNLMSCLLFATSIAILAVDFPLFDRRFAKTEMYGWSLMDVGVGGFIAINGGLSTEARFMDSLNGFSRLFKSIKSTFPLFVLGVFRLISVKSLNYQEHVSEYGVHWNFFFTICFTKIFASILCAIFGCFNTARLGLWLTFGYQLALTYGGITAYLNDPNRDGFLAANKEGIFSLIGSVGLYLIFVQYGRKYLPKRLCLNEFLKAFFHLVQTAGGATLFMYLSHIILEPTSRRETNLAFIFYMIAFISALISLEYGYFAWCQYLKFCHSKYSPSTPDSSVLDFPPLAIDKRYDSTILQSLGPTGLAMFLVANLLTGSVNFAVDTLSITSGPLTVSILLVYSFILIVFCKLLFAAYYSKKLLNLAQQKVK